MPKRNKEMIFTDSTEPSTPSPKAKPNDVTTCPHCDDDTPMTMYGPAGTMWRVCHKCGCHFLFDFDTNKLYLRTPNPDCAVIKERLEAQRSTS